MKEVFKPGDIKTYSRTVAADDIAKFDAGVVHQLYSTFAIARDAEWCTRLFVLEMKEEDEEGIGTFVYVDHISRARVGSEVVFTATMLEMRPNELICSYEVRTGDRILATGKSGQNILKKEKL